MLFINALRTNVTTCGSQHVSSQQTRAPLIIVSILVVAVVVVVVAMSVGVVVVVAPIPPTGVAVVSMMARPIARRPVSEGSQSYPFLPNLTTISLGQNCRSSTQFWSSAWMLTFAAAHFFPYMFISVRVTPLSLLQLYMSCFVESVSRFPMKCDATFFLRTDLNPVSCSGFRGLDFGFDAQNPFRSE